MRFQVNKGRNIELTDAIKGHLDNKINKIFSNADESTGGGHISLCVGKHRHTAHVTIKTNGGYAACTR